MDDSMFMRKILKDTILRNVDVEILEADCFEKAVKCVSKGIPDMAFLDVVINGDKNGIDVLKMLMNKSKDIKAIMLTSVGQDVVKKEVKEIGAVGLLMKPFSEEEIKHYLDKYF